MNTRLSFVSSLATMVLYLLLPGCASSGSKENDSADGGGSGGAKTEGDAAPENCALADTVFNPDTILEYHVTIDPSLYEDMKTNGVDEVYRTAALQVRGGEVEEDYPAVGIRYKGDYSLHHCWDDFGGERSYRNECAKLSLKLKFNKYDAEERFFGLKRLNLNSMSYDATKVRERLAYFLFNDFGVGTSRTAYAKVYINDEPPLLMLAVEAIDGRYTACNYPGAGDGDLYKEVWPRPSMSESTLLEALRTNDDPGDTSDVAAFIDFGNAVGAATESTFVDDMAGFVEIEHLLKYMAVDRATKNWDGITAFYWSERSHNNYWYHDDGAQSLFRLIPWDLDQTLWKHDPYIDLVDSYAERPVPNWNVRPLDCSPISVWDSDGDVTVIPSGCDTLLNLLAATKWDDFARIGAELLATSFRLEYMDATVTAWASQIGPAVDEDPLIERNYWESQVEYFRGYMQSLIDDLKAHLQEGYVVEQ